jgi:hypothetical protein
MVIRRTVIRITVIRFTVIQAPVITTRPMQHTIIQPGVIIGEHSGREPEARFSAIQARNFAIA